MFNLRCIPEVHPVAENFTSIRLHPNIRTHPATFVGQRWRPPAIWPGERPNVSSATSRCVHRPSASHATGPGQIARRWVKDVGKDCRTIWSICIWNKLIYVLPQKLDQPQLCKLGIPWYPMVWKIFRDFEWPPLDQSPTKEEPPNQKRLRPWSSSCSQTLRWNLAANISVWTIF